MSVGKGHKEVVEQGWHSLGEAGRRAGDEQTSLQTPTRTRTLGSSHEVVNKVRQAPLSDKPWTISIWLNSDSAGWSHPRWSLGTDSRWAHAGRGGHWAGECAPSPAVWTTLHEPWRPCSPIVQFTSTATAFVSQFALLLPTEVTGNTEQPQIPTGAD